MEVKYDFSTTRPRVPHRHADPQPPPHAGLLVYAGGSSFGSHAVRQALDCERMYGLSTLDHRPPAASLRDGSVSVIPDPPGAGIYEGPFKVTRDPGERRSTVYMHRGTLIHTALAHVFIHEALKRDGMVVVAGRPYDKSSNFYTAEDAVEAAAALLGTQAHTYALPATRRMLPQVLRWARRLVETEQVVAIETMVGWHLDAAWAYTSRNDLVIQNRASKRIRILDYKTGLRPEQDKKKYAASGQLAGQDFLGGRWVGSRWAGVVVVLIEDPGESSDEPDREGKVQEWPLPKNPIAVGLGRSVKAAQERVQPYVGRPIEEWPLNPFSCGDCRLREPCWARSVR